MSTSKVRMWFLRETEKAYQYTKLPPDRQRNPEDLMWIPKSQVEHRSKQPNGLHELTLPDWLVEAKNLLLILSLLFVMGCVTTKKPVTASSGPPLPLLSKMPKAQMRFQAAAVIGPNGEFILTFIYNTNHPGSYYFDLQESSNMVNWVNVYTNVSGSFMTVTNKYKHRFFRMRGHNP